MIQSKITVSENEGSVEYVQLSEVLSLAGLGDAKTANSKCLIEPVIVVGPLPSMDQRHRYIRVKDVPLLFSRYSRVTPEQKEAMARIIVSKTPDNNIGGETPTPDNAPDNPEPLQSRKPGYKSKSPDKSPDNTPVDYSGRWWNTAGTTLGNFYRSPLVAYTAFTAMVVALAFLHTTAAWRLLPGLPWWDMPVLAILMQSIILVGTFNASFFKDGTSYRWFLGGFAVYDLVMSGCNFFQGYDPTLLSGFGKELVIGIIDLAIRIGLSVGFTIGTLFFALLVKKIRT